jgi:hypothetical protein
MWTSGEAAPLHVAMRGHSVWFGRDRTIGGVSEAVRLRVEVERTGMFGLEPWQVRRHAWVEAMMRGRGEWDASGISAGCACGGRTFGVWLKAQTHASQDCLELVVVTW